MAAKGRASIETKDVESAASTEILMPSGTATEDIERPDLVVVTDESINSPYVKQYAQDLAFMEDELTIVVGETTDKNAENPVPCGVNGDVRKLTRGVEYKLKRKFVDSLIKAEDTVRTVQYKDKDGVDQTKIDKAHALKYPLSIIHDPAGDVGRRWFQHACKNCW